ncbi:hypothetical protein FACS1894133_2510 [Clostridia bacterium]|nr:hypothetical protein FACS1894133_2510 [Clostridia bacterium]
MSKSSYGERKLKLETRLQKEKLALEKVRAKIRNLQDEVKQIEAEQQEVYAAEFLNILTQSGFDSDQDKQEFLLKVAQVAKDTTKHKERNSAETVFENTDETPKTDCNDSSETPEKVTETDNAACSSFVQN